jgi:hypothetical protein
VLKSFAPAVAVASLASLALVHGVAPAAAKMTQCQVKWSQCTERCIMRPNYDQPQISSCIARTCTHQYNACARQSGEANAPSGPPLKGGGGGGRITVTEDGETIVNWGPGSPGWGQGGSTPRPPLGGGILQNSGGGGLSHQGPASTGSPAAPAAPRVIIR